MLHVTPHTGPNVSLLVRVVSVLKRGSARLCFAFGCVGREDLAMTLLGMRNDGVRLLCWMRAWLLCWLVLHGESSKRLASPRNTKDRKHLQSTQSALPTHLTDQTPSTTERTARETHNTK